MWRVLRCGGLFVLVTTMPLPILQALVLDQLKTWNGHELTDAYNLQLEYNGNLKKTLFYLLVCNLLMLYLSATLRTDGGGDVYYYSLEKSRDILDKREIIMQGISLLLEEAKTASLQGDKEWQLVSIVYLLFLITRAMEFMININISRKNLMQRIPLSTIMNSIQLKFCIVGKSCR
jgi:hypothetical protein